LSSVANAELEAEKKAESEEAAHEKELDELARKHFYSSSEA